MHRRRIGSPWPYVLGAVLALGGCAPRLEVRTDWSPTADFAALHTFAWIPAPPAPPVPPGGPGLPGFAVPVGDDLLAGRVQRAVIANLQSKGFRRVRAPTIPDFFVTYRATVRGELDVHSSPGAIGPFGGDLGSSLDVHRDDVGTLVIDVVGRDRARLLWRGSGEAKLPRHDAQTSPERDREVTAVVDQILEDFPPPA